jgi:hypothetical protein
VARGHCQPPEVVADGEAEEEDEGVEKMPSGSSGLQRMMSDLSCMSFILNVTKGITLPHTPTLEPLYQY